ncbi:MAG: inositol monophosphatase family protein [Candidatus Macondimonas sp.]|jgi:myo-inositol-1(or 4)-monophosphatase
MHPLLTIAVRAARRAGDVIIRASNQRDSLTIDTKQRNDFVTEVDRQAEQEIIQIIHKAYPDHAILGEEGGQIGDNEVTWIVDPLDGTTNFIHGLPHYAVSIGIEVRGRLEHGVIHDPVRGEIYTASRGVGAFLNDRRIRVTPARSLEGTLIGTGLPFRDFTHAPAYYGMLQAIASKAAGIRRAGSAALDLAYVASGRLDGYWELGLKPWDIAAGVVLVQEAGGIVGNLSGEPDGFMDSGNLVCGNPRLFAALVRDIQPHLTPSLMARS